MTVPKKKVNDLLNKLDSYLISFPDDESDGFDEKTIETAKTKLRETVSLFGSRLHGIHAQGIVHGRVIIEATFDYGDLMRLTIFGSEAEEVEIEKA